LEEELAIGCGGELDVLEGVGAGAYGAEHLFAAEDEFDWTLGDPGGHRGEDGVGPDVAFGAEAAADIGALDVDVGGWDGEGMGQRTLHAADALGGIVDVELVAVPGGDGGVRLHGVVILDRCGVDLIDDHGGFGEGGFGVAAVRGFASALGGASILEQRVEAEFGGLLLVVDAEELRGLLGFGQRTRDDDGDGLAVVKDVGVLEDIDVAGDGEFWRVERRG
jgi:hypothetical protein